MQLRQMLLSVLLAIPALSLSGQLLDLNEEVPEELRWVMSVANGSLNCVERSANPTALKHMAAFYAPGAEVAPDGNFKDPDFIKPMPDGTYQVSYWTIVISRFDPVLQVVPKEPANESECSRRWHASEVIAILVNADPNFGWFKNGYDDEILWVLERIAAFSGSRGCKKPPQPKAKPGPEVPVLPAQPAKVVRSNAAPPSRAVSF